MIEKDIIYKVSIDNSSYTLSLKKEEKYFYKIENAKTFLLHSYIKDFNIYDEKQIMDINAEIAYKYNIKDYGWIEVIEVED